MMEITYAFIVAKLVTTASSKNWFEITYIKCAMKWTMVITSVVDFPKHSSIATSREACR